ncbi:helix-turn-helix domain-containing protein [Roseospira goensis]|uniref:Cytoskeletal protein RodZ n=1 Tax=Roseospira goensis TaxID=391922 RepID=A0A7W6RZ71_9PROT|nr:helix-turn-helix domain-containing protein [Roseospira goensis]MBB4285949.1 cytoskeletal protein RodZ [Roseospira goensis]
MANSAERLPPQADYIPVSHVGSLLQEARLRVGQDLRIVAEDLRIKYHHLLAIEEGRFGDLPGPTYVTGFIRAYAEYLGLDAEEIVRRYKDEPRIQPRTNQLDFPAPANDSGMPAGALLLVALLLVGAAYGVWYWMSSSETSVAELIPEIPARLVDLVDGDDPAAPGQGSGEAGPGDAGSDPARVASGATTPAPPVAAGAESGAGAPAPDATPEGGDQTGTAAADAVAVLEGAAPGETAPDGQPGDRPQGGRDGGDAPALAADGAPAGTSAGTADGIADGIADGTSDGAAADTVQASDTGGTAEPAADRGDTGETGATQAATVAPALLTAEDGSRVPAPPTPAPEAAESVESGATAASADGEDGETVQTAETVDAAGAAPAADGPDTGPGTDTPVAADASVPPPVPGTDAATAADDAETAAAEQEAAEDPAPSYVGRAAPSDVRAVSEGARIVLRANRDSWIQVRQGGDLVVRRLLRRGDTYAVPGGGGYTLNTSNAGGLEVYVDGRRVRNLGPVGAPRNGVRLSPSALN